MNDRPQFAAPIRAAFPHLEVHAPQVWGWCAYWNSAVQDANSCVEGPDRRAHGDVPFLQWFAAQVGAHQAATGELLVTHLDVHAYPQANGVTGNAEDEATGALRLRSTQMFYNETYVDESWIAQPIALLPRLRSWLPSPPNASAPGMKIAVSEFNFGADDLVTAGLAHAETLAIFASNGVDTANVWTQPATGSNSSMAWRLFLNYDGAGGAVSGASVNATSADAPAVGAYAFLEGTSTLRIVLIGKSLPSQGSSSASIDVVWPATAPAGGSLSASAFGFSHAASTLAPLPPVTMACGAGAAPTTLMLPAWSATMLVVDLGACAAAGATHHHV